MRVESAPLLHSPEDHSPVVVGCKDEGNDGELDDKDVDDRHRLIQYMNKLSVN